MLFLSDRANHGLKRHLGPFIVHSEAVEVPTLFEVAFDLSALFEQAMVASPLMFAIRDRAGGGNTPAVLPHHRTCRSASGGS